MEVLPLLSTPERTHEAVRALARQLRAARRAEDAEAVKTLEEVIGELNKRYQRAIKRGGKKSATITHS